MDDKIAQSVKLMFETCEAELGVFPVLFGHERKSMWDSDVKFNFEPLQNKDHLNLRSYAKVIAVLLQGVRDRCKNWEFHPELESKPMNQN
jgi:hypothetical protein